MKRPVFIVGCPRSGTTLMYSMLVAAGGFAMYRKETFFYDLLPRFRELRSARAQQRFMTSFLNGYLGTVPGLRVEPFVRAALAQGGSPEEFLPLLMDRIATAQGMDRWTEATPAHVLYMAEIKRAIPDALFIHVIRDGRDCALSNSSHRWISTLPWDRKRRLGVAALFWQWMVRAGRSYGQRHPGDYLEVRFEQLIDAPGTALNRIGAFIDHDLDYERIQRNPLHALRNPNTSFREERGESFQPVGRWAAKYSPDEVTLCEALVGRTLQELGYSLVHASSVNRRQVRAWFMRSVYSSYFGLKHVLKAHTPLGQFVTSTRVWAEPPARGERLVDAPRSPEPMISGGGEFELVRR